MEYRKRYSTEDFLKKRLVRVGIPFVFWNVFYLLYGFVGGSVSTDISIREAISMFLNSKFQERYWFFWPLFAIYAAIPVLSLVLEAKNHRKYLWYTVFLAFALRWVMSPIFKLMDIDFNSYIMMPVAGGFLLYAIFGYLINTEEWNKYKRYTLYIMALLSGLFAIFYTINTSQVIGKTNQFMVSYQYFPAGLTGAAIFVFVKHSKLTLLVENQKLVQVIRSLSECCMGIWLTHSLVIMVLLKITGINEHGYLWRFVGPIVVFIICVIGVKIAKKIPLIKRIV